MEKRVKVQAKFFVKEIRHIHQGGEEALAEVVMAPVYGAENKPWSKFTPQGEIKMSITNPSAIAAFESGRAYFGDFTLA